MAKTESNKACEHESAGARCQPKLLPLVDHLLNQLLAPRCPFCGQRSHAQHHPCTSCSNTLPWLHSQCSRCALPLHQTGICGQCLGVPPPQQLTWAALRYASPVQQALHQLKFHRALELAPALGELIVAHAQAQPPNLEWRTVDALVPAPLHPGRLRQRGFNQALELCRPLARHFELALEPRLLKRCRATAEQSRLTARARQRNVRHAFSCPEKLNGEHIVLFDDVITTGATMRAMAASVLAAGAGQVSVIVMARTP